MELELLKKSWEDLNKKIQRASNFNQELVANIVASRTLTTVDKIKKMYAGFYFVLTLEIIVLIAILIGNPFDFRYKIQFLPYILLLIGVIVAFVNLRHVSTSIDRLSIGGRIDLYLKGIISVYDKNKRVEKWFGISFLSVGLLVPFSFLPHKIERMGLPGALLDVAIMISVSLVLYVLAFKLGAFRNRHKEKLEKDLADWEELKTLASGMDD
jgi:hypothetical protein